MGWTPKRDSGAGSADGEATPPPRRRRRPAAEEPQAKATIGARPPGGQRPLEDDPRKRRTVRLGKRWSQIVSDIKAGEYTWADFVDGLDEEELARGQLKAEDGTFKGRPPSLVPREFLLACQREQERRFKEIFSQDVLTVARKYVNIAQDENIPAKDRLKAMQYVMERIFGGIPKDVRVSQEQPWETMVVNVLRSPDDGGMPAHLRERYERYAERTGEAAPE